MSFKLNIKRNPVLKFDEAAHQYTLQDGTVIPSTTQILSATGVSSEYVNNDFIQFCADRGTRVHTAVEYYKQGTLDIDSVSETDRLFVESFIKFSKDLPEWKSLKQELKFLVCDDKRDAEQKASKSPIKGSYAGTIDDITLIPQGSYNIGGRKFDFAEDTIAIIDEKTSSSIRPSYDFQLAAYVNGFFNGYDAENLNNKIIDNFYEEFKIRPQKVIAIIRQLKADGTYYLKFTSWNDFLPKWLQVIDKYYYPRAKVDIKAMVKDQIDIPIEHAKTLLEKKELSEKLIEEIAIAKEEIEKSLFVDGVKKNGYAVIGKSRVSYNFIEGGKVKISYDYDKMLTEIKAKEPKEFYDRVRFYVEKCKIVSLTGGYYRMNITEEKTEETDNVCAEIKENEIKKEISEIQSKGLSTGVTLEEKAALSAMSTHVAQSAAIPTPEVIAPKVEAKESKEYQEMDRVYEQIKPKNYLPEIFELMKEAGYSGDQPKMDDILKGAFHAKMAIGQNPADVILEDVTETQALEMMIYLKKYIADKKERKKNG